VTTLSEIISHIEQFAPPAYQESYDNSGLLTGNPEMDITGALICLDSTEEVIDEAIKNGCNLVIAHHPIIFSGIKKLNGKNYVERTVIKAIRNEIAIYAAHTNLDNIFAGVNNKICSKLGLTNLSILSPGKGLLKKLITFAPAESAEKVRNALFAAGAGAISNYTECSFSMEGSGTFRGNKFSDPVIGEKGIREQVREERIEVIYEKFLEQKLLRSLREAHPYEEVAFDIYQLDNQFQNAGSGMSGVLEKPMKTVQFLEFLKKTMNTGPIRHTKIISENVQKIAVCGGSGSFLINDAIRAGADVFITSDLKYHQFFDAEGKIMIADIGHYESEQFTKDLIYELLKEKFPKFALRLSELNTNPINYF
jgi:dinuclear metal center YbgI/SA1388 family protein